MSDGLLIQTMQGILARLDQIDDIKAEIKDEYAQAKAAGYDKTALGVAIREIRGRDKAQTPAAEERASIVELYVAAFDNAPRTCVHVRTREERAKDRLSEAMADNKEFSAEMLRDGLISPEAHAENVALSDAVATKLGSGVVDTETASSAQSARKPFVLRPHCQRPELCASYGSKHCGECERLAKAGYADQDEDADVPAFVRKTRDHIAMGEQA